MSEPRIPRVRQYHIILVAAGSEDSEAAWKAIQDTIEKAWNVSNDGRDEAGPGGTMLHALMVRSGLLTEEAGRDMLGQEFRWRHEYPLLTGNRGVAPAAIDPENWAKIGRGMTPGGVAGIARAGRKVILSTMEAETEA